MLLSSTMSQSADFGVDVVSLLLTIIYAILFVCEGHQLVSAFYSKNKLYTYRNGIMLVLFCSALVRWLVWGKVTLLDAFYVDNTLMMVLYFLPVWLNFCAISLLCVFYAYAMFDGFYGSWPWHVTVAINVVFMALNVAIAVLLDYSDSLASLVYQFYIAYAIVLDTSTALVLAYFGYHFHRLSRANTRRLHWFLSLPKSPQTFTAMNLLIVVCFLLRSLLVGLLSSHLLASRDDNAVQFNRRRNATDEADGGSDDDVYRTSWTVMLFYLVSEVVPNCAMLYLLYLPAPRAKATASVSSGSSGGGRRGGWVALCNWLAVVSSRRGSRDADFDSDSDGDSDEDGTRALTKRILPAQQQRGDSDDDAWDASDDDHDDEDAAADLDDADLDDEDARIAYALQYQPSGPLTSARPAAAAAPSWWWPFASKSGAAAPGGRRRSNSAKFFYYFDQGQLRKQVLTPTKRKVPSKRRGGRRQRPRDAPRGSLISGTSPAPRYPPPSHRPSPCGVDRLGSAESHETSATASSPLPGPASPPSADDEDAPDVFMRRGLLRSHERTPPLDGAENPTRPATRRPPAADDGWWSSWSRHLFGSGDGAAPPPRRPRSARPASRKSGTPGLPDAATRGRFDADEEDDEAPFRDVPTTSVDEDHSIRIIYEDPPPPRPRFGPRHGGQFSGHVNMAALQAAHNSDHRSLAAVDDPRLAAPQAGTAPGVATSSSSTSSFNGGDAFAGASMLHAPQPRASSASIPLRRPSSTNLVATAASSQTSSSQASGLRSTPQTPSAMPFVRPQLPQSPEPGSGANPDSVAGSASTQALYDVYAQLTPHQLLQLQQREYLQHQQQQMQQYYQSLSRTATPSLPPPSVGAPPTTPSMQTTSGKRVPTTPPADGQ